MIKRTIGVILTSLASAACGNAEATERYFGRTAWRDPVHCPSIPALRHIGGIADLFPVSDTSFGAVIPDERQILVIGRDFRIIERLEFDKDGPRGLLHPVSAVITDTALFVADDGRALIRQFNRDGAAAGTVRLTFVPRRLRMSGDQLILAPLVAGGSPAHLAFRIQAGKAIALGGNIARYDDIGINTLANMTALAAFSERVVVMHEMVVPFGYVIRPHSPRTLPSRFGVPIPQEMRARTGRLPREPLSEKNVNELTVVAFAAAADAGTGSTYYVTRTGDGRQVPYQKLVVQLDSLLDVRDVIPINANPHHMIHFRMRGSLIVVDSDSEWFECTLPPAR